MFDRMLATIRVTVLFPSFPKEQLSLCLYGSCFRYLVKLTEQLLNPHFGVRTYASQHETMTDRFHVSALT